MPRATYLCCHACDTVFAEKHGVASLHCPECGEDFADAEHPELHDAGPCPTSDCDGELEGGNGCPNCGSGGNEVGNADSTCMLGHEPSDAPDEFKARAPRAK